jgi:NAD(P)H-nitrite reductase large subunit
VILATGIRANLDFLEGSGVETDAGILVDGRMQSSAAGLYAAGDVAQGPVLHLSERRVHAIQPTAVDHGRIAAANMLGHDVVYEGSLLMNIVATQGLEMASFGLWEGQGLETTQVENSKRRTYRKYVWQDDRLVGGILVGPTHAMSGQNDVGMLKGLVQTGVELGPWKQYLQESPLDLRRVFVASGAAKQLAESTLLSGRASLGGGFRFKRLPARRPRKSHHAAIVADSP